MFANFPALKTLIETDPSATAEEKSSALAHFTGQTVQKPDGEVVSFKRAAEILGYNGVRGVRKALHSGRLKGFYGGARQQRCTGIILASINEALGKCVKSESVEQFL